MFKPVRDAKLPLNKRHKNIIQTFLLSHPQNQI